MDYSDIDYQVHDGPLRCGRCAILFWRTALGFFLSAVWLVVGYTLAGAVLYGSLEAGLTSTPGLIAGRMNMAAAFGVGALLEKANFRKLIK